MELIRIIKPTNISFELIFSQEELLALKKFIEENIKRGEDSRIVMINENLESVLNFANGYTER